MTIQAGQKLRVSDLQALGAGTTGTSGGGGGGGGGTVSDPSGGYVMMAADITVTNSSSFVDATGLSFAVGVGTFVFHGELLYNAIAAADMKIVPNVPTGASGEWWLRGPAYNQTPVAATEWQNYTDFSAADLGTSLKAAGTAGGNQHMGVAVAGFVVVPTAGTFKLRVAQNSANATATVLRKGSFLRLAQVA